MTKNRFIKVGVIPLMVAVLVVGFAMPFVNPTKGAAETVQELRNRANALQQEINDNNSQAASLAQQGDTLKTAIASLDLQIQQASTQIQLTSTKIDQLQVELDNAQKELDRQKGLLKANMRALYKRGDVSSVELMVGSDSFSKYIDEV